MSLILSFTFFVRWWYLYVIEISVWPKFFEFLHLHTSVGHASCKRVSQVMEAQARDTGLFTGSLPHVAQVHAGACEHRFVRVSFRKAVTGALEEIGDSSDPIPSSWE